MPCLTGDRRRATLALTAFRTVRDKARLWHTRWGSFPSATCPLRRGCCLRHTATCSAIFKPVAFLTACRRVADAAEHPLPFVEAATAIRVMGNAEHTGKSSSTSPQTESLLPLPPEQAQVFRPDFHPTSSNGGLGGLGLFPGPRKMAAAGCGSDRAECTQPTQR